MQRHILRTRAAGALATTALALTVLCFAAGSASASTGRHTISGYSRWRSIAGITVAKHWSTTTFTTEFRSNGHLYLTTPKGTTNDYWTLPPTSVASANKGWDWYDTSAYGTGRSHIKVKFVWGVPTPWGSVGGSFTDTHLGNVSAWGTGYVTYLP
jgi:hypothetical protein